MSDPVFDPINVPNRVDSTAQKIDNALVTDAAGVQKHRQVVATGDPVDATAVGQVLTGPSDDKVVGPLVYPVGSRGEQGRQAQRLADDDAKTVLEAVLIEVRAIRAMLGRFFEDDGQTLDEGQTVE